MAHSETYIKFRDEYCPELDIDDPELLFRLAEEIAKLEIKIRKNIVD